MIDRQLLCNHPPMQPPSREDVLKMFADRLHLDSHQITQVDTILDTYRPTLDEYRKHVRLTRDTIERRIRAVLSPEQNKLYDDYIKELDQHGVFKDKGKQK
ncbi:MAG TPA: hypothetical protein VMU30_10910 [Bacteroidota bacterium]|nr:hypothetical protein [Bacteroidota bacterium]